MWPTVKPGDSALVLMRGRARSFFAVVLAVGAAGDLALALPPSSARGRWRPLLAERQRVVGLWTR